MKKMMESRRRRRPPRRIWVPFFGWAMVLAVSCAGTTETTQGEVPGPDVQQGQGLVSFREAEFRFAMTMLENGDFEGSRETLTGMGEEDDEVDLSARVRLALGVIGLLEMEDLSRMKEARDVFQGFLEAYPGGPYREVAERIVFLLDAHIKRTEQQEATIKQLTQEATDREQIIQTLQYKIEKVEEIHRETEEKRHILEGE